MADIPARLAHTLADRYRLERELGIGSTAVAGGVDEDDETIEFELDEYSIGERREITESLVAARVTHRWVETTLVVPAAAEEIVDEILDEFDDSGDGFADEIIDD